MQTISRSVSALEIRTLLDCQSLQPDAAKNTFRLQGYAKDLIVEIPQKVYLNSRLSPVIPGLYPDDLDQVEQDILRNAGFPYPEFARLMTGVWLAENGQGFFRPTQPRYAQHLVIVWDQPVSHQSVQKVQVEQFGLYGQAAVYYCHTAQDAEASSDNTHIWVYECVGRAMELIQKRQERLDAELKAGGEAYSQLPQQADELKAKFQADLFPTLEKIGCDIEDQGYSCSIGTDAVEYCVYYTAAAYQTIKDRLQHIVLNNSISRHAATPII